MKLNACLTLAFCATALAQSAPPPHPVTELEVKFFADNAVRADQAAEKARREALNTATAYLQAAQMRCRQKLATDPDYKSASDSMETAQRVLTESRSLNNAQLQVAASAQCNQASAKVKSMEDAAMAADIDVLAAQSIIDRMQPPTLTIPREAPVAGSPTNATVAGQATAAASVANGGANAQAIPGKRKPVPTTLEIGMTRVELLAFLNRNSGHYKVISFNASKPVDSSSEQVTTNTQQVGANRENGGPTVTQSGQTQVASQTERTISHAKTEYVTIAYLETHTVVVGSHRNVLGGMSEDTAPRSFQTGTIRVTLVDDVISSVGSQ